MKKTKDTQYLYLSANIRAQENRMVGTQALHKMISAATPEEVSKAMIYAAMVETYAILGLLTSILLVINVGNIA